MKQQTEIEIACLEQSFRNRRCFLHFLKIGKSSNIIFQQLKGGL